MIRKPAAPTGVELVVANTISTGRGVNEATIARVDRDVAYPSTLRKEHEVAYGERAGRRLYWHADTCHLP
jgi:hypothetical protein